MPVRPNVLERLLLYRLHRAPAPMLDLAGAGGLRAVTAAADLGVFESLAVEPATPRALARRLDCEESAMEMLLGFLAALGYVSGSGGRYGLTATTERWLLAESDVDLTPWLRFWTDLVLPFWDEHVESALREGGPPETIYEWLDDRPGGWRTAQAGFLAAARLTADEVVAAATVPRGATALLDVGGGHGLYSVRFCQAHPALAATVFDRPPALDLAREQVAEAGLEGRIECRGGDYTTDDLGMGSGDGYDLAMLFNVVHAHSPGENRALVGRVADALAPGGRVVVMDQFEGSARMPVARAGIGLVGLTYLVTLGARVYPADEVGEWLADSGFGAVERTGLRSAPGVSLLEARKEG